MVGLSNRYIPHDIPFGTLSVNLIGSFLMGALFAYFASTPHISPTVKSFLSTGLLGAFTTYSTFAMETFTLMGEKTIILAISNMALNLFGTILAAGAGYKLFQSLLHP